MNVRFGVTTENVYLLLTTRKFCKEKQIFFNITYVISKFVNITIIHT